MLLAKHCERAAVFFGCFADKGSIPYGGHAPWPYHENNGKVSMSAVLFSPMGHRAKEAQFFAKMAVAFRREASWHPDLVRWCDGSFTYDGGEQFGPGKTDDDTYYGKSGYYGMSRTATYVLTYALPLKKLCIEGKEAKPASWLGAAEVTGAIASGRFDTVRAKMSAKELVAAFGDWSPIVRGWAAAELSSRPEAKAMVPQLIALAEVEGRAFYPSRVRGARRHEERGGSARLGAPAFASRPRGAIQGGAGDSENGRRGETGHPGNPPGLRANRRAAAAGELGRPRAARARAARRRAVRRPARGRRASQAWGKSERARALPVCRPSEE